MAFSPSGVRSPPINTRSGLSRSLTAVPRRGTRGGKHREFQAIGVGGQDGLDGIGRLHRDGRLLDDYFSAFGMLGDRARHRLDVAQVRRAAGANTVSLGRGVDCHKDDVGFLDLPDHIGGKNRFRPRACATTSSRPGSKIGSVPLFQAAMRAAFMSTTVTVMSGHLSAIMPSSAHPRKPAPMQQMFINKKEAGMLPASEIKTKYDLPLCRAGRRRDGWTVGF